MPPVSTVALASAVDPETGAVAVEATVRLGLPNAWMADGISPNGVQAVEPITLVFPATFPLKPPQLFLRADFDRSLAHVNPGSADELPSPCIYDGSLAELLQQRGLAGILNQLVLWLENAALGRLIDPRQGWEPVRRDNLDDFIVADATHLRSLVSRHEGSAIFQFDYLRYPIGGGRTAFHGEVGREPLKLNPKTVGDLFGDPISSFTYFEAAAQYLAPVSLRHLAECYRTGWGVDSDLAEAEYLEELADVIERDR